MLAGMAGMSFITYPLLFVALYFEVFLLLTYIENVKEVTNPKHNEDPLIYPSVTIMVPVWNEEKTVLGTIESLLSLDYPKEKLKIFVIDDGSKDNTWNVIQKYKDHETVSLYQKENGGKFTALNLGLKNTDSDLVGCLDADAFVDSQALKRIVKRFEDKEIMAVTPSIKILDPKNPIELLQRAEFHISAFIRFVFSALNSQYITPGPFSIFRKSVFEKIGGYKHAHNTEDMEIALRMQKNGMRIDNAHNAYVYTYAQPTVKRLYKQRLRWIHGGMENLLDYKEMVFTTKYGTLSTFILPIVSITIFATMYFIFFMVKEIITFLYNKVILVETIGWSSLIPHKIDWFFMQTGMLAILSIFFVSMVVTTMLSGRHIANDKVKISKDMIFYILLYSLISPFWFIKAAYNTLFSKRTSWR